MSVSITSPTNNSNVLLTFTVSGGYDLTAAAAAAPGAAGAALAAPGSPGSIVVTVYQNDGTTPLPNTTVSPATYTLAPGQQSGNWQVSVTRSTSYSGAVIVAVLTPKGGASVESSVTGINIG